MWTKETIRERLQKSDEWVRRGIVAIWKFQTRDEKSREETIERNNVGFNGCDANFLTSLAQKINKGYELSPKQIKYGRKSVLKYAGQLARIANGNQ